MLKTTQIRFVYLTLIATLFSLNLFAQKPVEERSFEIRLEKDEAIQTIIKNNQRIDVNTGKPVALYGLNIEVPQGTPESMAQYYLAHEFDVLGIPENEIQNLRHHATRSTNAGSVVRYRQYFQGYPVNKAEVTIAISPQNKVVFVMNSYQAITSINTTNPTVSNERAYELAHNYLNVVNEVSYKANRLMIYHNSKMTRLANEVTISTSNPLGEWHVFIDAETEEIFKVVDMNQYYNGHKDPEKDKKEKKETNTIERFRRASGVCFVFDPDPLSSSTVAYGGGYVDNNDADSPQLSAARISKTLNDITLTGSTYSLVGPRAQIVDFDTPNTGLWTQNSSDFSFTRNQQGFEPANIYYHIDWMMDYINNTLGCNIMPYQYTGGVKYDPHGADGADQSYYTGGTAQLSFGEGCVDDGEDSDVIHHELGHGLHDWVTNGANSGAEGLGEGTGDYVAQSYNRSLGNWTSTDPQYDWVFNWDGHNECWNGRVTNYGATYPGGLVGQIHTDGQIWSTCLMGIWDQIGGQRMDKIFWEGLGMTGGTTGQNDAANAVYQAAINLGYTNAEINTIHASLTDCGYTLPALPGPPVADFSADSEAICLDNNNTVNFMDETIPEATSWAWTFEGGTPGTSTAQNPTVTYDTDGNYDVTLVATNSFDSDTITYPNFISVVSGEACPSCFTTTNNPNTTIVTAGANNSYTDTIVITDDAPITDVNVTINITHTWSGDLDITLTSPEGTSVELTSDNGGSGDNYTDTVFDMDGANGVITAGTAPFTGSYIPEGDLSALNGEMTAGNWVLTVVDDADADGGTWNSWSLELCLEPTASVEEFAFDVFSIFPNPNKGKFSIKLNSSSNKDVTVLVYDLGGRKVFNNTYINTSDFNEEIDLNNIQSGVYFVKVNDGERETIKKILVE
jgi:subtilisin-like proprotein convertase family protein/Zn-dependent metalloprotease